MGLERLDVPAARAASGSEPLEREQSKASAWARAPALIAPDNNTADKNRNNGWFMNQAPPNHFDWHFDWRSGQPIRKIGVRPEGDLLGIGIASLYKRRIFHMKKLRDIMTAEVEVIPPTSTAKEAAQKMKQLDAGALPVCDGQKLVGMITDRDIAVRAVAEGRDPSQVSVKDIMTHPITYCFDDQDIDEAARIMEIKQIRRLVVLNREKRLVGVIALGDIAARGSGELAGGTLGKVSSRYGGGGKAA